MATNSNGPAGSAGTSMYGQGGPTPWWQTNAGTASNLEKNAPDGYKYDPVQMKYVRTPSSVGADQGAAINGLTGALSGNGYLQNMFGGESGFGASGAAGAGGGGSAYGAPGNISAPGQVSMNTGGLHQINPYTPPATIQAHGTPAQVSHINGPDTSSAAAAAYAASKDQVGQASRGALTGLAGAMAGRGILGSGVEGRGIGSVINGGQQQLGDTSRALAQKQADLAEQNALASYQGDVTQRGQDLSSLASQDAMAVTQRGQDIGAGDAAMAALLGQRGQDASLLGQEYQGRISQRGQDIGVGEANAANALSARGQDIGASQFDKNYALQQQQLSLQKQAAILQGLQFFGGNALRGSTATY